MIQGETDVIKPALFQVAIRFCLGEMKLKIALTAAYLLLVKILPEPFKLVPTGLKWQTDTWSTKSNAFIDSGVPNHRD